MADAEVTIDASKGMIMVRGDQSFVSETLNKYKFIFEQAPKPQAPEDGVKGQQGASKPHAATTGLTSLDSVYDVDGDSISILVSPPGKSITAQAKSLILLYLYARLQMGQANVPAEEIKEQCKAHACYDPKNFFAHLKGQKNLVTVAGSGSTMVARLTVPGRKAAEELAQSLNGGS
jgi:hypothetical protein